MNFDGVLTSIASRARVHHAQAAIRQQHGTGSARWVAATEGLSERSGRRWMSATPPPRRTTAIIELVTREALVAQRLRRTTGIDAGTVTVEYDGRDEGTRYIGYLDVNDYMAGYLEQAAEALEEGDLDAAEDAFSNAVIGGYSPGLEDTLKVTEYVDGVGVIE